MALDFLATIAEQRIREAMARGEFDDLPGKGKPLELEDLSHVPPDLRVGYLMMKRANLLPEELEVRKEVVTLERLIEACEDDADRKRLRRRLHWKLLRYEMLRERRRPSGRTRRDEHLRIAARLGRILPR